MLSLLKSRFKAFNSSTFDYRDNLSYVVLLRYHENNELGFATVAVDDAEQFHHAERYHHLHEKKYAIDQFSVLKIADLNYGLLAPIDIASTVKQDDKWQPITPGMGFMSPCWAIMLIKRHPYFGEDEDQEHFFYALTRITADPSDPIYGLYMTIYHNKALTNYAMDILLEDLGTPYAFQQIDFETLAE